MGCPRTSFQRLFRFEGRAQFAFSLDNLGAEVSFALDFGLLGKGRESSTPADHLLISTMVTLTPHGTDVLDPGWFAAEMSLSSGLSSSSSNLRPSTLSRVGCRQVRGSQQIVGDFENALVPDPPIACRLGVT